MNYNTIIFELNEGLAVITLNRPDNLNSLNDELMREFNEAIQFCKISDEVRAVLVTGRRPCFCR